MSNNKALNAMCDVCTLKTNVFVPSEIHQSGICILAEAPGLNEAQEGRPLVGSAGQELFKIIENLGHKREDVNLLNSISCRPTKIENGKTSNRTPTGDEIAWCNERLLTEIERLSPTIIVSMGKVPFIALGGNKDLPMNQVVGTTMMWKNKFNVLITYHPAAIGYAGGGATERGREIKKSIETVIKSAFEMKQEPTQLTLL